MKQYSYPQVLRKFTNIIHYAFIGNTGPMKQIKIIISQTGSLLLQLKRDTRDNIAQYF